jgi:hypothetical protein
MRPRQAFLEYLLSKNLTLGSVTKKGYQKSILGDADVEAAKIAAAPPAAVLLADHL